MPSATTNSSPRRIVLGVTGGIAAYKAVELLRLLRDEGHFVSPVLTPDATRFVGEVTFSALASEPTRTSLYGDGTTPIPHTYLGQTADLVVVAPATAHFIARYAHGLADDLLTATLLATRAPVVVCPAMHTEMWEQPSVQENVATLRRRGVLMVGPAEGALAGGDSGAGRMVEPDEIATFVAAVLDGYRGPLTGRHVVISAGGTREALDPVRVVTNRSSGRQGYALAEVAARWGATVTLVSTVERDLALDVRRSIDVRPVDTAAEMLDVIRLVSPDADVVIMAAAVADFTFVPQPVKWKKADGLPVMAPQPTIDIVAEVAARATPGQVVVAFAAETNNLVDEAQRKCRDKNVDLVVANDVSQPGQGFANVDNAVTLVSRNGDVEAVTLRSKEDVAAVVLTMVASLLSQGDA